jgi:hypothetical protein
MRCGPPAEISLQDQMDIDFDWFCVDVGGCIAHFTSAGFKRLPESVARSAEDLKFLERFFRDELPLRDDHCVDEQLDQKVPEWRINAERYLRSFVAMAKKGLYSYDIGSYLEPGIEYFRVAYPKTPINISDLPEAIQKILARTFLNVRFAASQRISYELTLHA